MRGYVSDAVSHLQNTPWLVLDHLWTATFHRGWKGSLEAHHSPSQASSSSYQEPAAEETYARTRMHAHTCLQGLLQLQESIICMNYFLRRPMLGATMWVGGLILGL